jgi:hypothetical protein
MKPILDRIDFQPDQCLAGADLTQASRRTAELLALHAALGHDVWGVVSGYPCSPDPAAPAVKVGPGVALDACGRPLINSACQSIALPNVPDDGRAYLVDLVARWGPSADLVDGCRPRRMPVEQAELRWQVAGPAPAPPATFTAYSAEVNLGTDVPIARLTTATATAPASISTGSRQVAHPLVRPKIASGHVPQSALQVQGTYDDWSATIDTSSAGFGAKSSPVYLVSLDAHPFGDKAALRVVPAAVSKRAAEEPYFPQDLAQRLQTWVGPFVSINAKDHAWFTLRVITANADAWAQKTQPEQNPVPLSWVGVDTSDAGPPGVSLRELVGVIASHHSSAVIT